MSQGYPYDKEFSGDVRTRSILQLQPVHSPLMKQLVNAAYPAKAAKADQTYSILSVG